MGTIDERIRRWPGFSKLKATLRPVVINREPNGWTAWHHDISGKGSTPDLAFSDLCGEVYRRQNAE